MVPNIFFTTPMVTVLVAGPAERKTKAAPALTPESISPAAMGREAVAQTYIGIAIMMTIRYESQVWFFISSERFSGMATVINAPKSKPQKSGFAMSPRSVPKAYCITAIKENLFSALWLVLQQESFSFDFVLRTDMEFAPTGFNVENVLVVVSLPKIFVSTPATIAITIEVIAR